MSPLIRNRIFQTVLANPIKSLVLNPYFCVVFGRPLADAAMGLSCLSKFSRWLRHNRTDHLFRTRYDLYEAVFIGERLGGPIDYLEFGVFEGASIRWWVEKNKHTESRFVGFDTFTGLPEDWGIVSKGTFSTEGKAPELEDERCRFEAGMFQDKLPAFLQQWRPQRRTVVHLDADLYSSTLFVLTSLATELKKGDILIFDDFGSIRNSVFEFRAFLDFVSSYSIEIEVLGFSNLYAQVAMKIVDL